LLPLCLLDRSPENISGLTANPGGQPSITMPMLLPCDSPKMETLKTVPNEFILSGFIEQPYS
jgi:hypothetical protein